MKRHFWTKGWLPVLLLLLGALAPGQAIAQARDRVVVAYVIDSSNPGYLVLGGGITAALDHRTQYWIQPLSGKKRKATINNVTVEHWVRILLGPDDVARSVTVLEGQ
jgi:hypothetical protein